MLAQSIIQDRHRWQVGNDLSLDILKDKWLPQPSTFQLTSGPYEVPSDAKVSSLTDPHTKAQRVDMIR